MDKEIATMIVDFLSNGLGVYEEQIFCSSVPGHEIPVGQNFNDYILDKIRQSSGFYTVAVISNVYYNSKYCLYELGAAWGLGNKNGKIIPFMVDGMNYSNLQDFIKHNQAVVGDSENDINQLSDEIRKDNKIKRKHIPTEKFENERAKLIHGIKAYNNKKKNDSIAVAKQKLITKIKLVAFDFDGTILQGNNYKHSWKEIWNYLNYDDKIREGLMSKHKTDHKNYTFKNWCDECVKYFKDRNFKKSDVNNIIKSRNLKIATNFVEVVNVLNALGVRTIIISGGIDTFVTESVNDDNTLNQIECFVNKFLYDKEGFLEGVIAYQEMDSDGAGKVRTLEKFCSENDIDLQEVAFVGDEVNDIDVLKVVGKAIVYPANRARNHLKESLGFDLLHEDSLVHLLPKILS
jgi:HAD superfamily phosphoserine phosphatase-like hydrolase